MTRGPESLTEAVDSSISPAELIRQYRNRRTVRYADSEGWTRAERI